MRELCKPLFCDFVPPDSGRSLLEKLATAGFENPVLYGGSLRDTFRGAAFKDLDVRVSLPVPERELSLATAMQRIQSMPDIELLQIRAPHPLSTVSKNKISAFKVLFSHGSKSIDTDINLIDARPDAEQIATTGDAPINCIATDITGRIMAHADFIPHMERQIYKVLRAHPLQVIHAIRRYKRISRKFDRLALALDEKQIGFFNTVLGKTYHCLQGLAPRIHS